jgi:hypothetical protein
MERVIQDIRWGTHISCYFFIRAVELAAICHVEMTVRSLTRGYLLVVQNFQGWNQSWQGCGTLDCQHWAV